MGALPQCINHMACAQDHDIIDLGVVPASEAMVILDLLTKNF